MEPLVLLAVLVPFLIFGVALYLVLTHLLYICSPNDLLIISGRLHRGRDGKVRGYRLVGGGGRALRAPFLEVADRIDLSPFSLNLGVERTASKDGTRVDLSGEAVVRIDGVGDGLEEAIGGLLGLPRADIVQIAKVVLEGVLGDALGYVEPTEVSARLVDFAQETSEEASSTLKRLGLELVDLKVRGVVPVLTEPPA